jgi:hypothetical protein
MANAVVIKLHPISDVTQLVVREFPAEVQLEVSDRDMATLITARLTYGEAIALSDALREAIGGEARRKAAITD